MLDIKSDTFIMAAKLKSYTAAANALHLTQPAVTQHIKKLEAYYDCKLIDSAGHAVKLTKAGEKLNAYLTTQKANEQSFRQWLSEKETQIKTGATLSIADYYLPQRIAENIIGGKVSISVAVGNTQHLLDLLQSGAIDCAFIEGDFDMSIYNARVFCSARFSPVASGTHELSGKKISLSQMHQYPLILREEGSGTRLVMENYLHLHNDSPSSFAKVIEVGSFALLKQAVTKSNAISFIYEEVAKKEVRRGEMCFLDIENYSFVHNMYFIFRKGEPKTKMLEKFYEEIAF